MSVKVTVETYKSRHYVVINGKNFLSYMTYVDACLVKEAIECYSVTQSLYTNKKKETE